MKPRPSVSCNRQPGLGLAGLGFPESGIGSSPIQCVILHPDGKCQGVFLT